MKDLIKYYKFKYIGHDIGFLIMSIFKGVLSKTVLVFFAFTFVYSIAMKHLIVQTINTTYCR